MLGITCSVTVSAVRLELKGHSADIGGAAAEEDEGKEKEEGETWKEREDNPWNCVIRRSLTEHSQRGKYNKRGQSVRTIL